MTEASKSRVLLLGWDGADWKIIQHLVDKGRMPALARLMRQGVRGHISTLKPSLSPLLWSSIATGKLADKHKILGFTEPSPDGSGVRPISSESWGCKPLWRIASEQGQESAVVNWLATHPADVIQGTVVSDFFRHARGRDNDRWPIPPRAVSPESFLDVMGNLIVHPADVEPSRLAFSVPDAHSLRNKQDKNLAEMARLLAQCVTVHAAGTYLAKHQSWDLLAIYYDTLDRICHHFMKYRAPRMPYVSERDFDTYGQVVDHWYCFFDRLLAEYLDLIDEKTTILLVSDHGFQSDHLRPMGTQHTGFRNPLLWHRDHGILVCRGPSIKSDQPVFGASLLDIAPTVLHMLGLPVARDMVGSVLTYMYEEPFEPEWIDTYETSSKALPPSTPITVTDPDAVREALVQLADLGYIEPVPEDAAEAIEKATSSNQYTLADVYLHAGRAEEAAGIFEGLVSTHRKQKQVKLRLAECYLRMDKSGKAHYLVNEILTQDAEWSQAHLIYGDILLSEEKFEAALTHYEKAKQRGPTLPKVHNKIASVYLQQKRWAEAEGDFKRALALDEDNAEAYGGLGMALYHQGHYQSAVENLSRSVNLVYDQPWVHFHLGLASSAMDRFDEATDAVQRALALQPHFSPAQELLAKLMPVHDGLSKQGALDAHIAEKGHLWMEAGMEKNLQENLAWAKIPAPGQNSAPITIVTGLPRSGTSMMMQMLARGGMGILADGIRKADDNNPKGYFEFEKAKTIKRDASWLEEAEEKAVKLVCPLLYNLPSNRTYQVIFMERHVDEILASQETMLARLDKSVKWRSNEKLRRAFEGEVTKMKSWLEQQQNLRFIYVPYKDVVEKPMAWATRVNQFLGGELDIQGMAAVVDKALYRERR